MVLKLKERWRRFAGLHLTRPRRIVIDLALAAALLFWVWCWYGYPLPLGEAGQFRRLEQKNLLGEGELVLTREKLPGRSQPARLTKTVCVSLGETYHVVGFLDGRGKYYYNGEIDPAQVEALEGEQIDKAYRQYAVPDAWLELYPAAEGVQLLPINWPLAFPEGDAFGRAVLAVNLPRGVTGGTLTFTLPDGSTAELPDTAQEEGTLLFHLQEETEGVPSLWSRCLEGESLCGAEFSLRLDTEEGEVFVRGTLPEHL